METYEFEVVVSVSKYVEVKASTYENAIKKVEEDINNSDTGEYELEKILQIIDC